MARQSGFERAKWFVFEHFERVLVLVLVVSLLLIHWFIDYKIAFLSFYYLPIIVAGFYIGRNTAVGASLLIVSLVVFFQAVNGLEGPAGLRPGVLYTLIPWAGFLVLTGIVVGTLAEQRQARVDDLKSAYVAMLELVTFDLEASDKYHRGHSHRVARVSTELGEILGLPQEQLENLRVAALLHELGPQNPRLLHLLAQFPGDVKGLPISSALPGATDLLKEYERYYELLDANWPIDQLGLSVGVEILAVADAFVSLQTPTPHRPAFAPGTALEEIEKGKVRTFAPTVVKALRNVATRPGPLSDILAVIRELRAILPAQHEHEGLRPIQVNVVVGGPVVPYRPDEG